MDAIAEVRGFNRFYTRTIGVLQENLLDSAFSLTEVRVLYELAHRERPTATDLCRDLGLDAGYLSRILRRFGKLRLLAAAASPDDGRVRFLSLTPKGRAVLAPLERRSSEEVATLIERLPVPEQVRLVQSMRTIESLRGRSMPRPGLRFPARSGTTAGAVPILSPRAGSSSFLILLQALDRQRAGLQRFDGGYRRAAGRERREVRDAVHQRLAADAVAVLDRLLAAGGVEDEVDLAVDQLVDDVRAAFGDLEDEGAGDAVGLEQLGGAAGGDDLEPGLHQPRGEVDHAGFVLVAHRDEDAALQRQRVAGGDLRFGEGARERVVDAHHLAGRAHLGAEDGVGLGEPVKREDGFFDAQVARHDRALNSLFFQ